MLRRGSGLPRASAIENFRGFVRRALGGIAVRQAVIGQASTGIVEVLVPLPARRLEAGKRVDAIPAVEPSRSTQALNVAGSSTWSARSGRNVR